ncbi:hypothetical protein NQ315_014253 [Exocentrus adspersus]|uniref:HTH psq-type domain-containing protein n=1 Tax=Exocentrus adspersus TaxID=1586481 RepID=A0AAV8V9M7_9CUCU|nr:hypothetical protein NQ315_014253 [Exocentrus adspersus]
MPRQYHRMLGSRTYSDYSPDMLAECLNQVKNGEISQRQAAAQYKIPRKTLYSKLKNKHACKPGHPAIFSEEETEFEKCILSLSDYGFRVDSFDLRMVIKNYLNQQGRNIRQFANNTPGEDWLKSFLKRRATLSLRFAESIKRNRAAVNEDTLRQFIENLSTELENVPSKNIWNFDETNLTDNPGQKRVLTKRGCKYPKIRNSSKTSFSLMFCGSAEGELLPLYVVYKAQHMWSTWTEGGPKYTRYASTPSRWFDGAVFTDWFEGQLLPRLKKLEGKKVVLCDNLSSHITVKTLKLCKENNISLICLPANSTHLTQPLDIAFFRLLKIAWRKILANWKESEEGISYTVLQKQHFPPLLTKLMQAIEPNTVANLKSGFRKCGIVPINVELLQRLPQGCNQEAIENSFIANLDNRRQEVTKPLRKTRKRMNIIAGKSISAEDVFGNEEVENNIETPQNSTNKDDILCNDSSGDDVETEMKEANDEADFINVCNELASGMKSKDLLQLQPIVRQVERYVAFTYEGEIFAGQIVYFNDQEVTISAMQKSLKCWKWPAKADIMSYPWEDVKGGLDAPKQISKRGLYAIPQLAAFWEK